MTYNEKLVNNFILGIKAIKDCGMRNTKGLEVYRYKIKDKKYTETFIDTCIIDCDEETFKKWLIVNKLFNDQYKVDKSIGDLLDAELEKLNRGEKCLP